MAGLQGSGKTTSSAKLARWFKRQGRNPLLVGADLQRPAAVEQLRTLGRQIDVQVFATRPADTGDPSPSRGPARRPAASARDVLIVDTAGRLAIDDELMDEVRRISDAVEPDYTFLVLDAMTGQDAVTTAEAFHETLALDGVDPHQARRRRPRRRRAVRQEVTGRPDRVRRTGEKLDDLDAFHPDRMAGRILGMGDVLTPHRAGREVSTKDRPRRPRPLHRGRVHARGLPRPDAPGPHGPHQGRADDAAGIGGDELNNVDLDDASSRVEAIIMSMTPRERCKPDLIDGTRRMRIAKGSGVTVNEVNKLVKQYRGDAEDDEADSAAPWVAVKKGKRRSTALPPGLPRDWTSTKKETNRWRSSCAFTPVGKTKQPQYRIVAADARWPRTGGSSRSSGSTTRGRSRRSSTSMPTGGPLPGPRHAAHRARGQAAGDRRCRAAGQGGGPREAGGSQKKAL